MMSDPILTTPRTDPPRLALRPKDAARAIGIGQRKLWEITADQTSGIPHVRFGKAIVYPVADLTGWLSEKARAQTKRDGQ